MPPHRISILIVLLCTILGPLQAGIVRRTTPSRNDLLSDAEQKAKVLLERCEESYREAKAKQTHAAWAYASNITEGNQLRKTQAAAEFAGVAKFVAQELRQHDYREFRNEDLKRRIRKMTKLDYAVLPEDKFKELLNAIASMESNYAKIKVCSYRDIKVLGDI